MQPPDEPSTPVAEATRPDPPSSAVLEKMIGHNDQAHPNPEPQDTEKPGVKEAENGEIEGGSGPSDVAASAPDDEKQYPPTWQLVLVTIALCFALLLVSLVSCNRLVPYFSPNVLTRPPRIAPFSPRSFPASPRTLIPLATWHGTPARTSSPSARCSYSTASCIPCIRRNGSSWPAWSFSSSGPSLQASPRPPPS